LGATQWNNFFCTEQLGRANSGDDGLERIAREAELAEAQARFEDAANCETRSEKKLDLVQFAMQLLSPHNCALGPRQRAFAENVAPFAHYWTPCSHKYGSLRLELRGLSHAKSILGLYCVCTVFVLCLYCVLCLY
jgi:hypothetical protein